MEAKDPEGLVNLEPRGMVGMIYVGDHHTTKHCYIQFNLAMSNLLISSTQHVEVIIHSLAFPLYCFVFQTCLCRTWLSQNLGYIEVVFHSRKLVFRLCRSKFCVGQNIKQYECQTK